MPKQYPQIGTIAGIQGVIIYAVSLTISHSVYAHSVIVRFGLPDHHLPFLGIQDSQALPSRFRLD